jgi:glycosidase
MNQFSATHWTNQSTFYAIYPLGFCGAPARNDFTAPPTPRLEKISAWLPHIQSLGANALNLGPVFESSAHGYDTLDYFHVDRRLGTDETLAALSHEIHARGMRLILDGVFNHVGRDFWAFRDVREHLSVSRYAAWFAGLDFSRPSPYGDPFSYEGWAGNYDLVKLNLRNPEVTQHLFDAIRSWVERFDIDGLRLDAADILDDGFLEEIGHFGHSLKPDFWLMGEMVGGDYRKLAQPSRLDSATNYECYKGLYSSLAEKNYFEIAYALNRQFGEGGIYRGIPLYAFVDNHDVNRVASNLPDPALLFPLYCLLFTMPGIPSLYYGSEWGLKAERTHSSDALLRPSLDLGQCEAHPEVPDLAEAISRLARLRRSSSALLYGDYRQIAVQQEQFAFLRESDDEKVLIALNAAPQTIPMSLTLPFPAQHAVDLLNGNESFPLEANQLNLPSLPARWARVLKLE